MEKEKWKTIKNFKNIFDNEYEVSNYGNVRIKLTKQLLHKKIANKKHHPYYAVFLKRYTKNEWILVHQLVATFFCKIPDELKGLDIVPDHLDNNGLNNYYKNLEWKTRGENISSAFEKGYCDNSGENHKDVFITEKQANEICKFLEDGLSYDEIISKMNFENTKKYRTLLVRIKNGLAWKNVSKKYAIKKEEIKYTKSQMETIEKLSLIIKLMEKGLSNSEIYNIVWKGSDTSKRESKMVTLRLIRKGKIYTELIDKLKQ